MSFPAILAGIIGSRWLRIAGRGCILLIVILSLIPGRWQERTGAPGPFEHFIAYFGTAVILALAMRSGRLQMCIALAIALSGFSALMELLQNFSPGRDPQVIGFAGSSLGAACGAMTAYLIRSWLRRTERVQA